MLPAKFRLMGELRVLDVLKYDIYVRLFNTSKAGFGTVGLIKKGFGDGDISEFYLGSTGK